MTLKGTVDTDTWSVEATTSPAPEGGFGCQINITERLPEKRLRHAFVHHRTFENEADAVLEGLREGMLWIGLKSRHVFQV